MRTNKNCPKYGEDLEAQIDSIDIEKSGKTGQGGSFYNNFYKSDFFFKVLGYVYFSFFYKN